MRSPASRLIANSRKCLASATQTRRSQDDTTGREKLERGRTQRQRGSNDETLFRRLCPRLEMLLRRVSSPWCVYILVVFLILLMIILVLLQNIKYEYLRVNYWFNDVRGATVPGTYYLLRYCTKHLFC